MNVISLQFAAIYVKVKVDPSENIRHFLDVSEIVFVS